MVDGKDTASFLGGRRFQGASITKEGQDREMSKLSETDRK